MKTKNIKTLFYAIISCLLLWPMLLPAQEVTVNRVYDFSNKTDTLQSQLNYIYADSNLIIGLGMAYPKGKVPHAFTVAFDYQGNILWQRPIRLPNNWEAVDSGFKQLVKAGPDLYIAGGNILNVPKRGGDQAREPFLYFFNSKGDSLRWMRLEDSMSLKRLDCIVLDKGGNLVLGGYKSFLDGAPLPFTPGNLRHRHWFETRDISGNLIKENNFSIDFTAPFYYDKPSEVTNIIPIEEGKYRYVVATNAFSTDNIPKILWLGSNLDTVSSPFYMPGPPYEVTNGRALMNGATDKFFEFNFILKRGSSHTFYWAFPCSTMPQNDEERNFGIRNGLLYCSNDIPFGTYTWDNIKWNWYQAKYTDTTLKPVYSLYKTRKIQGRSKLLETKNGDLLIQREVRYFQDVAPYYDYPSLLRTDNLGETRWGKTFQYVVTNDKLVKHYFNDLSIAPDGRIVQAGYVNSEKTIGSYDTLGRVAWLVIMSDTAHNNAAQPSGTGIRQSESSVGWQIYPNPVQDNAIISLENFYGNPKEYDWQLCDAEGRVLQTQTLHAPQSTISLKGYAQGVYWIKILRNGKQLGSQKLIKQ